MTSINTNNSALAALQTLRGINSSLSKTQQQVSSGLRVGNAADNAAYWSIATTMRSEKKVQSVVQDSIGLGQSIVSTAYDALDAVLENFNAFKSLLVTARSLPQMFENPPFMPGATNGKRVIEIYNPNWKSDYSGSALAKLDQDAAQHLAAAMSAMQSASFNGVNLLIKDNDGKSIQNSDIANFVIGYSNQGGTMTLDLAAKDFVMINRGQDPNSTAEDGILDNLTGYWTKDATGNPVYTYAGNWHLFNAKQGGQVLDLPPDGVLFDLELGAANQPGLTRDQAYDQWTNNFDQQIAKITATMAKLGSAQKRLDIQENFTSNLADNISSGIGRLVDADMETESAKLSALQTQQQLAMQALGIANSSPSTIMGLFQ